MTLQKIITFLPKMTATFTSWFQTIAFLAQSIDVAIFPEPTRSRLVALVGLIQAIQAVMAHHYAPNGQKLTPGSTPYLPPPAPVSDRPPAPPPTMPPGQGHGGLGN